MFKKNKTGQAIVETIVVMGIYFFLIGFLISSFQSMYNKHVLSIAAYEAARTAAVYESSEAYAQKSFGIMKAYNTKIAEENAMSIINTGSLAPSLYEKITIELIGLNDLNSSSKTEFNGKQLYVKAIIKGKMNYMFPIINPDLSSLIKNEIDFEVSFTMPRERIWNT